MKKVQALRKSALLLSALLLPVARTPLHAQTASPQGNAARGGDLFMGAMYFQNGGTQCLACHSAAGLPFPGGGRLGPDLSGAYRKYGGTAGLSSVLTNVPFPTMKPVYQDRPLTAQEAADVTAFLSHQVPGRSADMTFAIASFALDGAMGLLVLFHFIWFRRVREVRKSLVSR